MSAVALRQPQRSPEREALAAAITRHKAAQDHLARVNEAADQYVVFPAAEAVEQAEQELAQARKREPERLVSALLGDGGAPHPTVEQCEQALAAARAALERAIRTRDALDGQKTAVEASVENAHRSVREAVRAVFQTEGAANPVLAQFVDAQREMARLREVLSFLSSKNLLPPYWDSLTYFPPTAAEAPWREALDGLENDADAALPDE